MSSENIDPYGRGARMSSDRLDGARVAGAMPQYTKAQVFGVWAMAAGPMAAIAWWLVPMSLAAHASRVDWAQGLILGLGCGLVWQCLLTLPPTPT